MDEYQFKYVMDFNEMWNDKDKEDGFDWWIYELYDEACTDELRLFYDIEVFDRHNF